MNDPKTSLPPNSIGARLPPELPNVPYIPRTEPKESLIVKRGEAIAHVRTLEETVERQRQQLSDGVAALRNCENQRDLLDEDRRKWRADAEIYRTILIELASDMHNIGLLTQRASETHQKVMNLLARETTEPEETPEPTGPGTSKFEKNLEHQMQKMRDAADPRTAGEILSDIADNREV